MYAEETISRGLFLKNPMVQIQRGRWGQSCLCLLAQESSMDEGNSLGGREVGLGGKELSPIQQGRAVVGFPKIERERGEIRAAREVGVARGTRFWGLG